MAENGIIELKSENGHLKSTNEEINQEMAAIKNENKLLKMEINEMRQMLEISQATLQQQMDELKQNYEQQLEEIKKVDREKTDDCFVWQIENLSKIEGEVFSLPFYSGQSGYKMHLSAEVGRVIFIFLYLIRGEYDDKLTWPFKHSVTIEVIDQIFGNVYESKTMKYSDHQDDTNLKKPKDFPLHNDRIYMLGVDFKMPAFRNDRVIVKCRIGGEEEN